MRLLSLLLLSGLSFAAFAQPPVPSNLEPLPPPPAFDAKEAPVDEPEVTIATEKELAVEEYRANGKVYMIKVTPKHGVPYYLVDDRGDGKFVRQESLDSGFRVPRWVILKF